MVKLKAFWQGSDPVIKSDAGETYAIRRQDIF